MRKKTRRSLEVCLTDSATTGTVFCNVTFVAFRFIRLLLAVHYLLRRGRPVTAAKEFISPQLIARELRRILQENVAEFVHEA